MKTIRFLAIFLLGIVTFAVSAQSSNNVVLEDLKNAVAEINAECPTVIDDDLILTSVTYKKPNIIMSFETDVDDDVMDVLEVMKEELASTLLEALASDDDGFIDICKATNTNVVVRWYNNKGRDIQMTIPYKDM